MPFTTYHHTPTARDGDTGNRLPAGGPRERDMSDQESEISQAAGSNKSASFSTNGTDAGGFGAGSDGAADGGQFLAELAKAMQTTAAAEQARNAEETEQRRQSHIDSIRAREAIEAEELRELAKDDVKGIDAWSDGEIKRIKLERERRIAARREQLQIRLEEHRTVVGREVEAVEASVGAYRADIAEYFRRLESETDPVAIARYAGTRPPFPDLTAVGPDDVPGTTDFQSPAGTTPADAPIETADAVEAAPVEVSEPVEVVAEAEAPPDTADEAPAGEQDAPEQDAALVGVMGREGDDGSPEQSWDNGEAVTAEQPDEAVPAALQEEPVAAEAAQHADGSESSEGTEESDGAKEEEPVGAVVMPRSTGAGSWLRWPNNSGNDPGN